MPMRTRSPLAAAFLLLIAAAAVAREAPVAHDVVGVDAAQLEADYWIMQQPEPGRTVLDAAAIRDRNARLYERDASVRRIELLPAELSREQVLQWLRPLSAPRAGPWYDEHGRELGAAALAAIVDNAALDAVPQRVRARHGLVTQRAALRKFPTRVRVFDRIGDTDIDRFQESALFPGTAVVVAHQSADGLWWLVVSDLYAAWIERRFVAVGSAAEVHAYTRRTPYLVVTGASARTVYTPEMPQVSALTLDMGVRVPLLDRWPGDRTVNGQHPYAAHVVELPVRDDDGSLRLVPALVPRSADVAVGYLALNRANLLRQGFKFLGERYGWGHDYGARDCSGFVSEVFRSFGVTLPRNTGDQAVSEAHHRIELGADHDHAARVALLRTLDVGDLVYVPGHVMMVIGQVEGQPYVIHDTTGISYRDAGGEPRRVDLNGVSVTPLLPLLAGDGQPLVDRITNIQRLQPAAGKDGNP